MGQRQQKASLLCFICSFFIIFTAISFPSRASAGELNNSALFKNNNILFYNPFEDLSGNGSNTSGNCPMEGNTVEEKIWFGLLQFATPEQAAGIMGNMAHESHFNPAQHEIALMNAKQPGFDLFSNPKVSYGIGLIQWSFGRRISFMEYIQAQDPSLVQYLTNYETYSPTYYSGEQFMELAGEEATNKLISASLNFLHEEFEANSDYAGVFKQTTVKDATEYFLMHVEKPKNYEQGLSAHPERLPSAEEIYEKYKDKVGSGGGSNCGNGAKGLQEYVLKYAWPEYHSPNYFDMKDDYKAAVSAHQKAGKYVGGGSHPGIDCGGFVTIILQDSGFEPEYNSSNGAVTVQKQWLDSHWTQLNSSSEKIDTSILQPGDVAISPGSSHTFVYVGTIDGFESNIASASYSTTGTSWRAPMAGHEDLVSTSKGNITWYRKK